VVGSFLTSLVRSFDLSDSHQEPKVQRLTKSLVSNLNSLCTLQNAFSQAQVFGTDIPVGEHGVKSTMFQMLCNPLTNASLVTFLSFL
jgi:hypothetical protein